MKLILILLLIATTAKANDWEAHKVEVLYYACECYSEGLDNCGYSERMKTICESEG